MFDDDIKIAGDKPGEILGFTASLPNSNDIKRGIALGERVAGEFINATKHSGPGADEMAKEDMLTQRMVLLSFAALSGFERFCENSDYASAAKSQFLGYLKREFPEVWRTVTDNGALSFYYLAFRRSGEVERRIGQTFAMLCSHDGDPVYQELGEALYCWFTSVVKTAQEEIDNDNT